MLYPVPSIIAYNTLELADKKRRHVGSRKKTFHFLNPLGMSCKDGKLCSSQQRRNFLTISYYVELGERHEDAFPNIHRLLLIACALQIRSVEADLSFSLMKQICTRSNMFEERFSDLAVIARHYTERFEVHEIYEAFVKAHPIRLFQATLLEKLQITMVQMAF